ncbi:MAG: DNA translocase FtsK 4TM domain-containing protein [Magnetococcales bacterium]|nr:DNA translocase FtsK 4TM domain-containing protein [Magnetococcales bacterium]
MAGQKKREEPLQHHALLSEIGGMLIWLVTVFVFVSLISYDHDDPSFNSSGGGMVRNLAGSAGAHTSDILLQLLGYTSFLIPLFLALVGTQLLRDIQNSWPSIEQLLSFLLLVATLAILAALLIPADLLPLSLSAGPGGVAGFLGMISLKRHLGVLGSLILLLPLLGLALVGMFRFSLMALFSGTWGWTRPNQLPPNLEDYATEPHFNLSPSLEEERLPEPEPQQQPFDQQQAFDQQQDPSPYPKGQPRRLATLIPARVADFLGLKADPVAEPPSSTVTEPDPASLAPLAPPDAVEVVVVDPIINDAPRPIAPVAVPSVKPAIIAALPPLVAIKPEVEEILQRDQAPTDDPFFAFEDEFTALDRHQPKAHHSGPRAKITNLTVAGWHGEEPEFEEVAVAKGPGDFMPGDFLIKPQHDEQHHEEPHWEPEPQPSLAVDRERFTFEEIEEPVVTPPTIAEPDRPVMNQPEPVVEPVVIRTTASPTRQTNQFSATLLPPLEILKRPDAIPGAYIDRAEQRIKAQMLEQKLEDFKIKGQIVDIRPGPVVTTFELDPAPGLKSAKVISIADDLARSISAMSVRVVGNIPGKSVIGIEVPNEQREVVYLREILTSQAFRAISSPLAVALGFDITGQPVVADLAKMPHLLVAGTTGSGKSVAINAMVCSILFSARPDQVRMLMIDPKMVELSVYAGIPHLLAPVVTDVKKAAMLLKWAVVEMEDRTRLMSELSVRNIEGYNQRILDYQQRGEQPMRRIRVGIDPETDQPVEQEEAITLELKPLILIIIDELADLMIQVGKEVEPAIARLAQMARAAGIHLIIATQRPSVDVITGLIKANFPTRLAFQVASRIDSRTILDSIGAERLLGKGDGLYMPPGSSQLKRIHAPFVSDDEVFRLVQTLKENGGTHYDARLLSIVDDGASGGATTGYAAAGSSFGSTGLADEGMDDDPLYDQAVALVVRVRKISTSMVQRHFKIGYNRAARIVERMEKEGLVSETNHVGKREVMIPGRERTAAT